jgi:hypothetical protein
MKNIIVCLALLSIWSCQEDVRPTKTKVKYEVLVTSGNWVGEYLVETGAKVCTCDEPQALKPSGWILEFDVTTKPFVLHLDASTDCICRGDAGAPDVTTNIYVDNKLVATNKSNWAPGVASADFTIP